MPDASRYGMNPATAASPATATAMTTAMPTATEPTARTATAMPGPARPPELPARCISAENLPRLLLALKLSPVWTSQALCLQNVAVLWRAMCLRAGMASISWIPNKRLGLGASRASRERVILSSQKAGFCPLQTTPWSFPRRAVRNRFDVRLPRPLLTGLGEFFAFILCAGHRACAATHSA